MAKRLKRPRDPISLAKLIGDIATGQVEDNAAESPKGVAGAKGGVARAKALPAQKRQAIAKKAAKARWEKAKA
jgi:hypothetical protein